MPKNPKLSLICAWMLVLTVSSPRAGGGSRDIKLWVSIPQYSEAFDHNLWPRTLRSDDQNAHFSVVVENISSRPLELFTDGNSEGDQTLSFDIKPADGRESRVVKEIHAYSKNIPEVVRLQPGEVWVRDVFYNRREWAGFERAHGRRPQKTQIVATLSQKGEGWKRDPDVWSGRASSPPLTLQY